MRKSGVEPSRAARQTAHASARVRRHAKVCEANRKLRGCNCIAGSACARDVIAKFTTRIAWRFGFSRKGREAHPARRMSAHPYAFLALFLVVAIAFPLVMLTVARTWARAFRPARPGAIKNSTYESGVAPTGDAWIQFRARYYLYAILFLIFDVEVLFLLPFAVAFTGGADAATQLPLPAGALIAMLVFVLLLAEGLVWAWQRGHLEWQD